jgi:hypothetical protein
MSLQPLPDALLAVLDETTPTHIVHVDGGDGSVLAEILGLLPRATGALVDGPDAVAAAGPLLEATAVADRVDVVDISADGPVPAGGDIYLIVDRDRPRTEALLVRCRAAMATTARLIACEPPDASRSTALPAEVEGAGFTVERVEPPGANAHSWRVVVAAPVRTDHQTTTPNQEEP